jgi:hypothetical protein
MNSLTINKKLPKEVKTLVVQTVYEVLNDPDFGLELSGQTKRKLRQIEIPRRKNIPFSEIKKKFR